MTAFVERVRIKKYRGMPLIRIRTECHTIHICVARDFFLFKKKLSGALFKKCPTRYSFIYYVYNDFDQVRFSA